MEHRAPGSVRQDQLVDVSVLRLDRVLALEGMPVERETTRLGGHEHDLSVVLAESNLDGLTLERRGRRRCGGGAGSCTTGAGSSPPQAASRRTSAIRPQPQLTRLPIMLIWLCT